MRTISVCISVLLVLGDGPCLAQSGQVQSLTDKDPLAPAENLGFERQKLDEKGGLAGDWAKGGHTSKTMASSQLTASEANKANYITLTGGGGYRINRVTPGPNDKIVSVTIIYNGRFVDIPGASISKGGAPGTLKTGLTSEYFMKLDAGPYNPR